MSFLLTDDFDDSFVFNGKTYHINLSFDNVLRLLDMFEDEDFHQVEKPALAIEMLIEEELPELEYYEEILELFYYLMKEFLDIDFKDQDEKESKEEDKDLAGEDASPTKIYDFKKDAEIIYASFLHVYKMDLFEMHGKLHWKKFMALVSHLSDDSKFKQVIGYRTMKIPTPKESSQEYINHIRKMKELYSLDERSAEEKVNSGFETMSRILKAKANIKK